MNSAKCAVIWVAYAFATGCYAPSPSTGLPCSADNQCPSEQICSPAQVCVSPKSIHLLDHDRAIDFDQVGATFENAEVRPEGAIELTAWTTHGLRMAGVARATFADADAASWDALVAELAPARSYLYLAATSWLATSAPMGLALTKGSDVTLLIDGEVYLDAGSWKFELRADDLGFLELATPATAVFTRVAGGATSATGTYEAAVSGWYPVRVAVSNAAAAGSFSLRAALNAGVSTTLDATRLRAPVSPQHVGLIQDAFDSPGMLHWRSSTVVDELRKISFDTGAPPDSGVASGAEFSVRWSGQFLVDDSLDGFTVTSEGGHRLWIDGVLRADKLDGSATSAITGLALGAGWHDIVLDLEKRAAGPCSIAITNPLGDATVFSSGKVRPVIAPAVRWMSARSGVSDPIPDPGAVSRTLSLPAIEGTPSDLLAELSVSHAALAEISIDGRRGSVTRSLAAAGSLTGAGRQRLVFNLIRAGLPAQTGGSWVLTAADNLATGGASGTLDTVSVTALYSATGGASEPFARTATYTSAPIELGEITSFGRALLEVHGVAASAALALRSGDTEAECTAAAWQPVDDQGISAAPPGQFVQYQVTLRGDGLHTATLDRFTLEYWAR